VSIPGIGDLTNPVVTANEPTPAAGIRRAPEKATVQR
jgi:hypothetical protein